jgi:hypothetical protein
MYPKISLSNCAALLRCPYTAGKSSMGLLLSGSVLIASSLPGPGDLFRLSLRMFKNGGNEGEETMAQTKTLDPNQIIGDLEKLKKVADEAKAAFESETAKRELLRQLSRAGYLTAEQKKRAQPLIRKARRENRKKAAS